MITQQNLPFIQPVTDYKIHLFTQVHSVPVFQGQDGFLYATLDELCQAFGLDQTEESKRIQTHPVLTNHLGIHSDSDASPQLCLRLGFVGVWLLTVSVNVEKGQQVLINFQENAAQFLEELFCEGRLTEWPLLVDLLKEDALATEAYRQAVAILGLARDQLIYSANGKRLRCE